MAVMVTVAALAVPGIGNALTGLRITNVTQTVVEEIQLARSTALAQNAPVEVWFLKENGVYRALRSALIQPDNVPVWTSRLRRFPEGVAFASNLKYSNVIGAQTEASAPSPGGQGVRLRVYPSGRTELVDTGNSAPGPNDFLFLTVTKTAGFDPAGDEDLPSNFATVQINPINTRITTHRP
jgi:hypothetical protein